jgi:hypothetical protein
VNFGLLPEVLARVGFVARWTVLVEGDGTNEPCTPAGGAPSACMLVETGAPPTFGSLSVSATVTELVLKGTIKAVSTAQIHWVRTALDLCSPTQLPTLSCRPVVGGLLTERDVTSLNIVANADQTMDVTVRISFS